MDSEKVEGERSCFTSNTVGWGVSTKAEVRNAAFDIVGLKKKKRFSHNFSVVLLSKYSDPVYTEKQVVTVKCF